MPVGGLYILPRPIHPNLLLKCTLLFYATGLSPFNCHMIFAAFACWRLRALHRGDPLFHTICSSRGSPHKNLDQVPPRFEDRVLIRQTQGCRRLDMCSLVFVDMFNIPACDTLAASCFVGISRARYHWGFLVITHGALWALW